MGRRSSQGTAAGLAVLVAGCPLLATAGDAFVTLRSITSTPAGVKGVQLAERSGVMAAGHLNVFKATAASVALLCLAASRLSKTTAKPSSIRYAVVSMTAGAPVPVPKDLPQFDDLLMMESVEAVQPCTSPTPTPPAIAQPLPAEAPLCGKTKARFAAGARRRSRAASSRAARRAIGQRLCERAVHCALPASYDVSKVRTKIQLGVRVSSCLRSESGRESKVSAGMEESEMGSSTCRNFVAHDLKDTC